MSLFKITLKEQIVHFIFIMKFINFRTKLLKISILKYIMWLGDIMFFEISDFDFKILTVLNIDRKTNKGFSGLRPFHTLSLRLLGDATFTHENDMVTLGDNSILFVPKNYPYYINSRRERLLVVHFNTDAPMPRVFKYLTAKNIEKYQRDLLRLYSAWSLKRTGYEHECKYLLHKIFMNI